jgi:hypothetical protein
MRTRAGFTPILEATRQDPDQDWVYGYWDRDKRQLYIGIAYDVPSRAYEHSLRSRWWRFVEYGGAVRCSATDSRAKEKRLIGRFSPLFNDKHSRLPWSVTIEYLASREAWDLVDYYVDRYELDDD